jgi:CBS domain-containing protein
LGTSREGIDFNSPGTPPVHVVILILTPKDDPGLHLQVLSALAKDFGQPETVRQVAALETPADILKFFNSSEIEIPGYLRAKDVMNSSPVTLLEEDSLKKAIEIFAVKRVMDIPVIDDDGDLRGVLSLEDILKFSLPEHILWMENLAPILRFQPFSEMLRNENETRLADLMNTSTLTVEESIPAVQLAKIFLMDGARQIIVTRHEKLVGVVNLNGFITKLFWA